MGDKPSKEPYTNERSSKCRLSTEYAVGSRVDEEWGLHKYAGDPFVHRGF